MLGSLKTGRISPRAINSSTVRSDHSPPPRGERLVDKVPQGKWKIATFLATLRNDRIDAPCLFDGPINGERFRAYVEQLLAPTLKPGDVFVILDNLGSHKGKAVRKAIRDAERASCSCRNNPPTSTPSSRSSPSSKLCRERPNREPTKRSPTPAAKSSPSTRPPNAPHTSRTQDTRRPKSRTL
jgi:DDE superfamily endonuclease